MVLTTFRNNFEGFACLVLLAAVLHSPLATAESPTSVSAPATYANPLITENNPADPDVLHYQGNYYMYATTHGKGYDVYVSTDLVHWKNEGMAFNDPRGGAWAPDLFHNAHGDGKFYLYYTDNNPDSSATHSNPPHKQIGVAVSEGPLGPFNDKKVFVIDAIDAHVFEDTDGKLYLYYADISGDSALWGRP